MLDFPLSLPLGAAGATTLYDSLPELRPHDTDNPVPTWKDPRIVSLEWRIGSNEVALRHYHRRRVDTDELRVRQASGYNMMELKTNAQFPNLTAHI